MVFYGNAFNEVDKKNKTKNKGMAVFLSVGISKPLGIFLINNGYFLELFDIKNSKYNFS